MQDAGEAGLAGVTVKLLNNAGSVVATTTTDANGNYLFNNLTPGDYSAQVVAPSGYFVSAKDQGGNDATDSDIDPTTGKYVYSFRSGSEFGQASALSIPTDADGQTNGISQWSVTVGLRYDF